MASPALAWKQAVARLVGDAREEAGVATTWWMVVTEADYVDFLLLHVKDPSLVIFDEDHINTFLSERDHDRGIPSHQANLEKSPYVGNCKLEVSALMSKAGLPLSEALSLWQERRDLWRRAWQTFTSLEKWMWMDDEVRYRRSKFRVLLSSIYLEFCSHERIQRL